MNDAVIKDVWRLTVCDSFAAAHALRHYEGKCENMHGHNFQVEVSAEGWELAEDTEILLDFKILKTLLKLALEKLDHRALNDEPPFDAINPSSENLSRHIWREIAAGLEASADPQAKKVRLVSVSVSEKPGQQAAYLGKRQIVEK